MLASLVEMFTISSEIWLGIFKWFVSAYNYCSLPALLALVEMSSCECKKECLSNKCKHFKNNLVCTDLCKYILCENDEKDIYYAEKDIYVKSDDDE